MFWKRFYTFYFFIFYENYFPPFSTSLINVAPTMSRRRFQTQKYMNFLISQLPKALFKGLHYFNFLFVIKIVNIKFIGEKSVYQLSINLSLLSFAINLNYCFSITSGSKNCSSLTKSDLRRRAHDQNSIMSHINSPICRSAKKG